MTLEQAIAFAALCHEGQQDKVGATYILHPLRVMLRVHSEAERRVAVLHDVVEDCGVTPDMLRRKEYEAFIGRAGKNALAWKVKLADLADNLDRSRFREISAKDEARFAKYQRAKERLEAIPWPR
jgi:hypothetical protein